MMDLQFVSSYRRIPAFLHSKDIPCPCFYLRLELSTHVQAFVMPELNYGQMFFEMQRVIGNKAASYLVPHGGGTVHDPEVIYGKIREAAKHAQAKDVA